MNINGINYIPGKTLNISKPKTHGFIIHPLKSDIVSFSGKNHVKKENSNTAKAVEFGEKLIQLLMSQKIDLDYISYLLPDIQLKPIEDLKSEIPDFKNYVAFFTGQLSPNFDVIDGKIYLDVEKANKNSVNRLCFIMNSAHEYTHALQAEKGNAANFLKLVSKDNYEYAKLIQAFAEQIFKPFDTQIQGECCAPVFKNSEDLANLKSYGMIVPREKRVSAQDLLNALGYKNEKEFKSFINYAFKRIAEYIIKENISNPQVASQLQGNNDLNKLISKIKKYCAVKAQEEKEAYMTESTVAKKAMKTDSSLNVDIFPIYYSLLEKAFES